MAEIYRKYYLGGELLRKGENFRIYEQVESILQRFKFKKVSTAALDPRAKRIPKIPLLSRGSRDGWLNIHLALNQADFFIGEFTLPTLISSYELGQALGKGLPSLVLFPEKEDHPITVLSHPLLILQPYRPATLGVTKDQDLEPKIKNFISKIDYLVNTVDPQLNETVTYNKRRRRQIVNPY